VPPTLPDASGFTERAVPIALWALATVEAIATATTSDSVEIQSRPNILVVFIIALLFSKKFLKACNPELRRRM
jgi:hypothetical protein